MRWIGSHAEPVAFGLVVTAMTYLSLIVGELVPKQVALGNPERIASFVSRPMRAVARFGRPLVLLLTGSTNLVFRIFGIRASANCSVTEQDVRALLEQGAEVGVVTSAEHAIMENTFRLGERRVSTVMTPRLDVPWVDLSAGDEALRARLAETRRSPIRRLRWRHRARLRTGVRRGPAGQPLDPGAVLREPLYVPLGMPVLQMLETFRSTRRHAAIVLDEFGGVAGVATADDMVEGLVAHSPPAHRRGRRARAPALQSNRWTAGASRSCGYAWCEGSRMSGVCGRFA